jgi:hypothetical protein
MEHQLNLIITVILHILVLSLSDIISTYLQGLEEVVINNHFPFSGI